MLDISDIEYIGFNRVPRCNAWVTKYFTYYVLDYCEKGCLSFQMGDKEPVILTGPIVWLTFPGPYFKFGVESRKTTWHHRFVSFKGALPDFYAEREIFPLKQPVIQIKEAGKFTEAFDRLLKRLGNAETKNTCRTLNLLEDLLLMLNEQPSAVHRESPSREKINKLKEEITQKPEIDRDFRKEAIGTGLSYSQFRKVFEEKIGMPPGQFLLHKRLEKAAEMLRNGNKEMGEIAYECGFYDIYHLTKMFRKYYSEPPGKYRKNHNV